MNLKKLAVLAGMAMALIAFAIPASASAEWTKPGGGSFEGKTTIVAHGPAKFNTPIGGVSCEEVTATFVLEGGTTTGYVEGFDADHESECHGSGNLANCTVSSSELTGANANEGPILHAEGTSSITVTDVTLQAEYETTLGAPEPCPVAETELDFESSNGHIITVDLDPSGHEIHSLTLTAPNGGILTAFGLEVPGVEVEGELTTDESHTGLILDWEL